MAATAWNKMFPDGRGLLNGNHLNRIFTGAAKINQLVTEGQVTVGGVLTTSAGQAITGGLNFPPTTVAAAGATQGTATAIVAAAILVLVTVTASTEGVKLPTPVAGKTLWIAADTAVGNKVYPAAAGQSIGTATTATTAYVLAKNTVTQFFAKSATKWLVLKGG